MKDERIPEMINYLRENLSEKRFQHSLNVASAAERLAGINGADSDKAYLSGLLHDICKEIPPEEQLELMKRSGYEIQPVEWGAKKTHHAVAGAQFVREKYGITDPDIVDPIRWHTVGKGGMNIYEKIKELRELTYRDLPCGLYEGFRWMLQESLNKQRTIPQSTFDAYNEYTDAQTRRQAT